MFLVPVLSQEGGQGELGRALHCKENRRALPSVGTKGLHVNVRFVCGGRLHGAVYKTQNVTACAKGRW